MLLDLTFVREQYVLYETYMYVIIPNGCLLFLPNLDNCLRCSAIPYRETITDRRTHHGNYCWCVMSCHLTHYSLSLWR